LACKEFCFEFWLFEFVSDFEIRASDLVAALPRHVNPCQKNLCDLCVLGGYKKVISVAALA